MRLSAFTLALCVCLYQVNSASIIAPEKKHDVLDVSEPDLVDQPRIADIDNNLRKNIIDIPVKIIQESNIKVLDENSNDYVPSNDDSINIKRFEIDITDPGMLQRQEHETQNPDSNGEREKAIFYIKQSIDDTQNVFNKGLKSVSNSFKTLFAANKDLPAIQENIQNLRQTFEGQIEKLNNTIRSHFKEQIKPSEGSVVNPDIEVVSSGLRNLENNFKSGVDTLTEGVEVLSTIREEDEAARAEGTPEQTGTPDASAPQPAAPSPAVHNPSQITQPVMGVLNVFQQGIITAFENLNYVVHYAFTGEKPPAQIQPGKPILNFFQRINNIAQAHKPSNQGSVSEATPASAQNDAATAPAPPPAPAPWNPGSIFQQVQNSIQNIIRPQQNQQQFQPQPAHNGPISQTFQNIVQFIRPGQQQQQQQQVAQPASPAASPTKAPETAVPIASNAVPANPAPAVATPVQAPLAQAFQAGTIQQLVQNNPIIKGIQVAVQRIQNPSADTPRNEEVKENINLKEHFGGINNNNFNQGDLKSSGRIENLTQTVEIVKDDIPVKCEIPIAVKILAEEIKTQMADKNE